MFIKKSEFEKQIKDFNTLLTHYETMINNLTDRIELVEFKQENPLEMAIVEGKGWACRTYYLKYIKGKELREIELGNAYLSDFNLDKNGHIVETNKAERIEYKFDINREILIQIKETNLNKENKKGKRRVK